MEYRKKNGITYASLGGAFPAGSTPVRRPAAPLVLEAYGITPEEIAKSAKKAMAMKK